MTDYVCTSNMTLEACITAGPMTSGDNLTINAGAVVTCDRTPSVLIGQVNINDGKLLIDGINIGTGNMINFVGEYQEEINVNGQGTFEVNGDWFDIGTTDGTNSQAIDLSSATGVDYWDSDFCVDVIPMIQIETGRRIDFDNPSSAATTALAAGDWVYLTSDRSVMGKIKTVASTYLIVWYLTGTVANDAEIQVRKIVDNEGPDLQVAWTADVNNASGDIKESGVYQEFGNCRAAGVSYISAYHHGVGGFVFDHAFQSTTLTLGSALGTVGGFVAPSGCNIRVPNVHFSTSNTTQYASNNTYHDGTNVAGNWYNIETGNAGDVDLSVCNTGSAIFFDSYAFSMVAEYVGATVNMGISSCGSKTTYDHCVVTMDVINDAIAGAYAFNCSDSVKGTDITFCLSIRSKPVSVAIGAISAIDVTVTDCISTDAGQGTALSTSHVHGYYFYRVNDIIFNNNVYVGNNHTETDRGIYVIACFGFESTMFLISMTQEGIEQTQEKDSIYHYASGDIKMVGIEIIEDGTPGNYLILLSDVSNIKLRCFGMINDKVDFGVDGEYAVAITGLCSDISCARMWKDTTSSTTEEFIFIVASSKNITVENCSGKYASLMHPSGGDNVRFKGLHAGSGTPGGTTGWGNTYTARYGNNFHDSFRSDTVGTIGCVMVTPSTEIDETTIISGTPKFFKDGDLDMVSGDVIEFEMGYFAKGHVSFPGTYTSTTGASAWNANEWTNITLDFQWMLDGGSWNGSWLNVRTALNWTGITGDIKGGIKLKFRFTATGTQTDMSMLLIDTTTTITDQKNNMYPIDQDECDVILNGVVVDSRYWIYDSDTSTELAEGTASADPVTENVTVPSGTNLLIRVRKSSASVKYEPFITTAVTNTTEINVAIIQQIDEIAT